MTSNFDTRHTFFTQNSMIFALGEHIDYCGYAVFPMALEQDIVIAFAASDDDKLKISNTDERFR